jgi:hypothetical protein
MTQIQEEENDEIVHMFAASGVYIQMSPWPPPFTMMGRQDCATALKITLSQGRPKCKMGDDEDIPFMDTTTSSWCDTKTSFKYDKLILIFFHQLF